ncbi:MAG: BREX-6 system adenine-specific DNA-methyltransferase PglX [Deltaproteobacteria bacterium]|nr:MAG: BREX-6 system adenine-specific DNA-methyltransferase PglX [Deltaproteobacteria bacterium]
MPMTADAKTALSSTIQGLRARLLDDLHASTETAYRLSVRAQDAGLSAEARDRRKRLEDWIAEQRRADLGAGRKAKARSDEDHRRDIEKQAAYTLLNRLIVLRILEARPEQGEPLRAPPVVTGGWESRGYKDFRSLAPALVRGDPTEGYATLLQLLFEDLALDLPGIFGPAGVAELVPITPATLRAVIEALDAPALASCWTDELTLGWVYQYWNDPERDQIDAQLNSGKKLQAHQIASKTQLFTERYMVDWLLQNSLGPMWLAMCRKHGWTPEVQADGTLDRLEARRVAWRAQREAGEVPLTALMPLESEAERRWAYYVPQPIPQSAVAQAPETVRDLRLLDPAMGSGHFLLVAFDLLTALYREEARHRGEQGQARWSDQAIAERILSHNLHGIDLDARAVQIAAASLWIRARRFAHQARPQSLNLVASNLRLASLPDDDPALVELRREVESEIGVPAALTDRIVHALRGADHLGSLLRVDGEVSRAISEHETALGRIKPEQGGLFTGFKQEAERVPMGREAAKSALVLALESFLDRRTSAEDLGLRMRGAQLAAGVRFVRLLREGSYDLVVGNPPYQGTSKMADAAYVKKHYELGKADLFAAFLLRGLELAREGGTSALLTMRNWMFIKQYAGLREHLLALHSLRSMADLDWGSFAEMKDVKVNISIFMCGVDSKDPSLAIAPTGTSPSDRTAAAILQKEAGLRVQTERYDFDPAALKVVPEWPLVYWWGEATLSAYQSAPLIGVVSPAAKGLCTCNDTRFLRFGWESQPSSLIEWVPSVHGAKGVVWMDPCDTMVNWNTSGLEIKADQDHRYSSISKHVRSPHYYFRRGVAFSMIGSSFTARVHRYPSIFGNKGSSVFPDDLAGAVCAMNSTRAREILESLNPGIGFEVGDVNRLPLFPIPDADRIFAQIEAAFSTHEAHREPSVEFRRPGPSPWTYAQDWAQRAVDRPEGAPLPPYEEVLEPEPPTDHLSFALGVALGRFGPAGEGVLDPSTADLSHALPAGILFLDTTLDEADRRDGLGHPAAAPLHAAWQTHRAAIGTRRTLRAWLAADFFKDVHRQMYDNRPIHWPLSSAKRTFVAWVNIHRMNGRTLRVLLADHLMPALSRLEGALNDLREARDGADQKASRAAEKQFDRVFKAKEELVAFIEQVEACADQGPPPVDRTCPPREQDAAYDPDLDDGVMINSAALWPLLEPQWKDPKKWAKELATAKGRKDYDWSHLAMRYWPTRVDKKCQADPSLGVAHGCFWRYHPERAWAWELRLQDEIAPDFRIEEPPYRPGGRDLGDQGDQPHRATFLAEEPEAALAAIEKEAVRRMGRGKNKRLVEQVALLETGLWTHHAEALWEMELKLSEKQGVEVRITAPDEEEARAAFEAENPGKVAARREIVAGLVPPVGLFEEGGDEEELDGEE